MHVTTLVLVCGNNNKHMEIIKNHMEIQYRQWKIHGNHYDNHIKLEGAHGGRRRLTIPQICHRCFGFCAKDEIFAPPSSMHVTSLV